mgnify:CR=1 FL=1
MATTEEEFEALKLTAGRPIPGQSLTNDPENPAPFEKAPAFTSVHAASGYLWESFIEPRKYRNLMTSVADGVPLMTITQVRIFTARRVTLRTRTRRSTRTRRASESDGPSRNSRSLKQWLLENLEKVYLLT